MWVCVRENNPCVEIKTFLMYIIIYKMPPTANLKPWENGKRYLKPWKYLYAKVFTRKCLLRTIDPISTCPRMGFISRILGQIKFDIFHQAFFLFYVCNIFLCLQLFPILVLRELSICMNSFKLLFHQIVGGELACANSNH